MHDSTIQNQFIDTLPFLTTIYYSNTHVTYTFQFLNSHMERPGTVCTNAHTLIISSTYNLWRFPEPKRQDVNRSILGLITHEKIPLSWKQRFIGYQEGGFSFIWKLDYNSGHLQCGQVVYIKHCNDNLNHKEQRFKHQAPHPS